MKARILITLTLVLFVSACSGTLEIGIEPSGGSSADTPVPPAATLPPSLPTAQVPLLTPESPTLAPTDAPLVSSVQVYLVALEDNGVSGPMIGCGDSVVPVTVQIAPTQAVLRSALDTLLRLHVQYYGQSGLYNALYQSDLQVESLTISDGVASVYLTGTLLLGGECDNPRLQAQLEQTVLQFATVTRAEIFINGRPLADVLSLK